MNDKREKKNDKREIETEVRKELTIGKKWQKKRRKEK